MSSSSNPAPLKIGFPAPLLGRENLRLPVLLNRDNLLALNVPAGILMQVHPWHPRLPILADAVNAQLEDKKPELLRLGFKKGRMARPVFSMDPQIAGIALLAKDSASAEAYRNDYGSELFKLVFNFIGRGGNADICDCDLPIAQHFTDRRSIVSHSTGKKTETKFERLERLGDYSLWRAETRFYRPEQLFVHALERGIAVVGDQKYTGQLPIYLSHIKRDWRGDKDKEQPLYEGPAAWLAELTLPDGETIVAEPQGRLANLLKQLRRHA